MEVRVRLSKAGVMDICGEGTVLDLDCDVGYKNRHTWCNLRRNKHTQK